jgi:hypothetical protein
MVQGIASLGANQMQQGQIPQQAVQALGQGFDSLTKDEIDKLRELQDDLSELSPDKLKVLEQIIVFLKKNQDRYDDAVKLLVSKNVLEPGDLPPDYIPAFFEILDQMVRQAMSGSRQGMARGGIAAMRDKAEMLRRAGTGGDKVLAHINPREAAMLQATRGGGRNPVTGLPEYGFFDDIGSFLKSAASVVLPVALSFTPLGPIFGAAVGSGVASMINGGGAKEALNAALTGGFMGALGAGVAGAMSPGGSFFGGIEQGLTGTPIQNIYGGAGPSVQPMVQSAGDSGLSASQISGQAGRAGAAGQGASPGILQQASNWISRNPIPAVGIAGLGGVALASAMQPEQAPPPSLPAGPTSQQISAARFPAGSFAQRIAPKVNVVPTYSPAYPNYPTYYAAEGGELDARVGGHLHGPGTGTSDSIPAKLSDGEFVMTAKAVRGAGEGDRDKGARKMYALMHQFEKRA